MKDIDKKTVLLYMKEQYPNKITSLAFDKWAVQKGITLDNAKRRLRELQEEEYIKSEWVTTGKKRYKEYWYTGKKEEVIDTLRYAV